MLSHAGRGVAALLALAMLLALGCASTPPPPPPTYNSAQLGSGSFSQAVDGFLLVLDASGSMSNYTHIGRTREARGYEIVNAVATSMIASIPELSFQSGVRSFGQGNCLPAAESSLLTGMSKFSRGSAQAAVDQIACSGGPSPLGSAFEAAITDFAEIGGKKAVIVVSDGLQMGSDDIRAAAQMHAETGACIYAVQVGDSPAGRAFLEKVVATANCGSVVSARELQDSRAMGDFVTMALLARSAARPTPPAPPADSDGDGVTDDKDKCPGTPRNAPVDENGCELEGVKTTEEGTWTVSGEVLFASNRAELRPEARRVLDQIADFLERNEAISVTIEGHTDSMGSEAHNQDLSQRRAQAAVDYIAGQGVAASRLGAVGKGESEPTAPNDTPENRAKNRRVEFIPSR